MLQSMESQRVGHDRATELIIVQEAKCKHKVLQYTTDVFTLRHFNYSFTFQTLLCIPISKFNAND